MREIKVRAWDKKGKKWFVNLPVCIGIHPNGSLECFSNGILVLYTGLKDKNDKEIYAGDIVYSAYINSGLGNRGGWTGVVEIDTQFGVQVKWNTGKKIKEPVWTNHGDGEGYTPPLLWSEVIGNIYENPELLNK